MNAFPFDGTKNIKIFYLFFNRLLFAHTHESWIQYYIKGIVQKRYTCWGESHVLYQKNTKKKNKKKRRRNSNCLNHLVSIDFRARTIFIFGSMDMIQKLNKLIIFFVGSINLDFYFYCKLGYTLGWKELLYWDGNKLK